MIWVCTMRFTTGWSLNDAVSGENRQMILLPRYGLPGSDFIPTTASTSATVRRVHGSTVCAVRRGARRQEPHARNAVSRTARMFDLNGLTLERQRGNARPTSIAPVQGRRQGVLAQWTCFNR